MAKKYWDGNVTLNTDWGGDSTTNNLPLSGGTIQKLIKDNINSKVGYVGRVDKIGQGFYVLCRDEETFHLYEQTITDENPFGNLEMDGVNGRFDAPFNYKMEINVVEPDSGYKSVLVGSTGNFIKFTAQTLDANNTPQGENLTITFKIITEGGVENTYTAIYDGIKASSGIEYNLDGKLGVGQNSIIITAVGMNTGISAMRRIAYRLIDISFSDKFDILKRYQFSGNTLEINVGYSLKGVGRTKILWYFDGEEYAVDTLNNVNPNIQNANRRFNFSKSREQEWLTVGKHNIQMSMICTDIESGEEFQTPIYYREFIIEDSSPSLTMPFILRKISFDAKKGFLSNDSTLTIYNVKQFENTSIEYGVYYNAKSDCEIKTYISYNDTEPIIISSEKLPMINSGFSELQKRSIGLEQEGNANIILKAFYSETDYIESGFNVIIGASDMNITTITEDIALSLNAFGRSNNSADRDSWTYTNENGVQIKTIFSKNEYVMLTNISDSTPENTLEVDVLPTIEQEGYKYVKYNNNYYIWTREFDWSNTSGWADNKLKLANGNAITIKYMPFSSDKLENLKKRGGTYEFEFETTNVYNDDAVICSICGGKNNAPGIVVYASGAELVISREIVNDENDVNFGYMKAVSTKYKSEESNRISFVITPDLDDNDYRNRILKIYVNGELCGAYPYDNGTNFLNDSEITFRGSEEACVNISSIQIYERELSSNEILNNYIYFRNNPTEKAEIYRRNDIMLNNNDEAFNSDKLKSQLPVMMFYQIDKNQSLDDIHQEKINKKLTRFFDVVYIDIQNPSKNFLIKNAYVTPQGTSSMDYPVKNLRLYTGKKDKAGNYYSRLFVGSNIFKDGSPNNIQWENINLETEVTGKRKYSFRDATNSQKAAAPVNCWCLKADFAESSSSHNTGTARFWNNVLKTAGFTTKAQIKAAQYSDLYDYDVRTCIDGFPIVVFYQSLNGSSPRFEGKYNFNNDKSTEDVFGFTGGKEVSNQEVKYFYIGKERPIIQYETDEDTGEKTYACSWSEKGYTDTPTSDSPLYTSDDNGNWYMLRGKDLLDNPKMECWELLNSVNDIALFKTMKGFGTGDKNKLIGIVDGENFYKAFESRYPDCGDYYHYNSLKHFGEWLVSCRYLDIDQETGESVPFVQLPSENYYKNNANGKISICSLTKQQGNITINFPGVNFYKEVSYEEIKTKIKNEGYQVIEIKATSDETIDDIINSLNYLDVETLPDTENKDYDYLRLNGVFYSWLPGNVLKTNEKPNTHQTSFDYVLVENEKNEDGVYYVWSNVYKLEDYHPNPETNEPKVWVDDTAFNRALKFAVEKYDHIDMEKMAAYYIYLMRFGGVDQTVKNAMLTTEGPANNDPLSTLPSLWYFINYDNDTILGVKNDGRLVFDPYITRQTKDGTGYVYAGRESTLWNNLENDTEFMETVTKVDNILATGEGNSLYALSYNNAIREYDTNQSDKWCERIYNKDAERKYIQTYVEGWTQHNDEDGTVTENVYDNFLYDIHGSRSAHRKWWLGRRFNVFDSRFCNDNFKNSLIKFRSTNLPVGSSFTIKSGEPIFYAWGHDDGVAEMTPTAIQPGNTYTFTTKSTFNIGSYLKLMGAANIATLDLRDCVGALTEIDITGCYSNSIGTKMKEIHIGDHTRTNLINNSPEMKFSGLNKASKLEYLDITNINISALDGLNTLLNIRELYAEGSSVANFTLADGSLIETLKLPKSIETLSLTKSSNINYNNILFENFEKNGYGKLKNVSIDNCAQLMNDHNFILDWIEKTPVEDRKNLSVNLQGINWVFDDANINRLFVLGEVGTSGLSTRNIRGTIHLKDKISVEYASKLQKIFGEDCFKEGSLVYIKAPTAIYLEIPTTLWEGDGDIACNVIAVGTTLTTNLDLIVKVIKNNGEEIFVKDTDNIITVDSSNIKNGIILFNIKENDRDFKQLYINVSCKINNINYGYKITCDINKRIYPTDIQINSVSDSFNNKEENPLTLNYNPNIISDLDLIGRGFFTVYWSIVTGTSGYNKVGFAVKDNIDLVESVESENAYIQTKEGFDGRVTIKAIVIKNFNNEKICEAIKELEFTDPDTIVTELSNKPLYDILVKHGIITVVDNFGKLNKNDAGKITMNDLIDKTTNKSIFEGNKELTSFVEFEWFNNSNIGDTTTPIGMFKNCTNLKEIALSDNFKYGAKDMFSGCTNLESIYGASNGFDTSTNQLIYTSLALSYVGENFASDCTKLSVCKLLSMVDYIGQSAFKNCESLTRFSIPNNTELEIVYNIESTPFVGCKNIEFVADYTNDKLKYFVKNGALYKENDDDTVDLIHMGKNTLISDIINDIPTGKTIYAYSYSMEYRNENEIIIPANIRFNGNYIFNNSSGNSITLNNLVTDKSDYLFSNTYYKGNYHFATNEYRIPKGCFSNIKDVYFTKYEIPNNITTIHDYAFSYTSPLQEVVLPSQMAEMGINVFYYCDSLRNIIYNGKVILYTDHNDLFRVYLNNIYCNPEEYDVLDEKIENGKFVALLKPIVKLLKPRETGFIRIIKDGKIVTSQNGDKVTVGGVVAEFDSYDYWYYKDVYLNGDVYLNDDYVGEIKELYTTIYLGDNSSLYEGYGETGYDFTHGIYDDNINTAVDNAGWYYDSRFNGIRSKEVAYNGETTLNLILPETIKGNCYIEFGASFYKTSDIYYTINNERIYELGYNQVLYTDIIDNEITFKYKRGNTIKMYADAFILNKIGKTLYSDPIPSNIDENNYNIYNVSVTSIGDIPNDTPVIVTDGFAHTYRKYWNGKNLEFKVPKNYNFICYAEPYLNESGKLFTVTNRVNLNKVNNELMYEGLEGIEVVNNILYFYTEYNDYYINLEQKNGIWSDIYNNIDGVTTDDVLTSDTDGLLNTELVLSIEENNVMFKNAYNDSSFDSTFKTYIPSFIEIELLKPYLNEINSYITNLNYSPIDFSECWTSEAYDERHAWLSNGKYENKNTSKNYYIFGRKINIIR